MARPNPKWVWDNDPSCFFLNENNTNTWIEYSKGVSTAVFRFVQNDEAHSDPIIFDKTRNLFAKIGDRKAVFGFDTIESLNDTKFYVLGKWITKPAPDPKSLFRIF